MAETKKQKALREQRLEIRKKTWADPEKMVRFRYDTISIMCLSLMIDRAIQRVEDAWPGWFASDNKIFKDLMKTLDRAVDRFYSDEAFNRVIGQGMKKEITDRLTDEERKEAIEELHREAYTQIYKDAQDHEELLRRFILLSWADYNEYIKLQSYSKLLCKPSVEARYEADCARDMATAETTRLLGAEGAYREYIERREEIIKKSLPKNV